MAKFMTSCKADVEKYCADAVAQRKAAAGSGSGSAAGSGSGSAAGSGSATATPAPAAKGKGRGQVVACLNTNIANLTPECKTAFEARKAATKAKKN